MKNGAKLALAAVGLTSAGFALLLRLRAAQWRRETADLVGKLKRAATANPGAVSFDDFGDLPAPVAAYFRFALKNGQAFIRTAKIHHEGEFKLNEKWVPFVSAQDFSVHPSGFVWDAAMKMNRLVKVRVRDSYQDGRGAMSAKILSLVSVVDAHDDAQLDEGALMRYLAELVWMPTALLPSENLKWTPIDAQNALVTLRDCHTTVSLEFHFKPSGEISGIFAPARPYAVNEEYKPLPWAGRFWNYQQSSGMMIPQNAEVSWQMPQGNAPYYKAKIVTIQYD